MRMVLISIVEMVKTDGYRELYGLQEVQFRSSRPYTHMARVVAAGSDDSVDHEP